MYTRVLSLIISRLVIVLTLLGLGILVSTSFNRNLDPSPLVLFSVVVSLLSFGYYLLLRLSEQYQFQTYLQVGGDVLLTTWLIYLMRASEFSLVPLYLVIVLGASMVLPRSGVILTGLSCLGCFAALLLLARVLPPENRGSILSQGNLLPQYALALLLLTVLGGQLAERLRRSDTELETATRFLADLRAFNERIVQSINSGLVTTDLTGTLLSFNRAAEEITGYRAARVRGRHFFDIFGDLSYLPLFKTNSLPQGGGRLPRFDIDCQAQDGRSVHLGFSASPLVSEGGSITGYVFSFQDLTEVIKLEQEIRRRDRLAALGKMAAGIAHEIRNPLAAMRGSIQLLQSEMDLNEDQAYLMQIVVRESDRLDRIISDFLAYARPSPLRLAKVDITACVEETLTLLRNSPEVKNVHEINLINPVRPLLFVADSGQIRQVIWNLSRNAIQAMTEGGKLDIRVALLSTKELEIRLNDTGPGMSEEQLERMFEPFNSSRPSGTGLGMAIVYQIVSDHQGRISVTSSPATALAQTSGTEIIIRLPEKELPHTGITGPLEKIEP
ncbi:MAG: PAS domain S-box protein [Blastocatellia bacterium]|nr:PAS domain S-box protein [Blastocatellia bacterium]